MKEFHIPKDVVRCAVVGLCRLASQYDNYTSCAERDSVRDLIAALEAAHRECGKLNLVATMDSSTARAVMRYKDSFAEWIDLDDHSIRQIDNLQRFIVAELVAIDSVWQ